jgi:transcriptional regulator with XRE-family HTH domain
MQKDHQGLLDENGWTRAELARQFGVSRAWVSMVLNRE